MNEETKPDPMALFFDEEIYFPFEVTENQPIITKTSKQESSKTDKKKTVLRMASVFNLNPTPADRQFYEKILQAIGRRRTDTQEKEMLRPSVEELIDFALQSGCNALVVWGYTPQELNLNADRYQMIEQNRIKLLFSHSLNELAADKSGKLKRQLWTVLREHFQS